MSKIPFNIKYRPQIESGKYKVETATGCPVRIVCWDMVCELPILGLVLLNDEKAEEMAVGFTNEGTNLLEEPLYDKLFIVTPEEELKEFENGMLRYLQEASNKKDDSEIVESTKKYAAELLKLAREQFIKDGYIIEKKAFRDAVENISDKHRAEMSVQYSIHCKVEDGTRHAIMNWNTFQKVAQKFIDIGKAEALKDLPRWERCYTPHLSTEVKNYALDDYDAELWLLHRGRKIDIESLEKLPGFKKD